MLHALTSPIESVPGEAAALTGGFSLSLFNELAPGGRLRRPRLPLARMVQAADTAPAPATATEPVPSARPGLRSRERAWPTFSMGAADTTAAAGGERPEVIEERCFSLLRANDSAAARGSLAANVYRGCSIGCAGCPAASQTVHAKSNAVERLREELRQPRYQVRPLQIGSTADAYQPIERELRLTRGLLELLHDCGHPVILVTRSPGVLRDLDLLIPMAQEARLRLLISLCTLDEALSARLEPKAAPPAQRLATIRRLSKAGVPVGLHFGPVLPGLTEDGAEALLEAAARAGARSLQCSFVGEPAIPVEGCTPGPDPVAWQRVSEERLRALAQRFDLSLQAPALATVHFRAPPRRELPSAATAPCAAAGPNGQACLF